MPLQVHRLSDKADDNHEERLKIHRETGELIHKLTSLLSLWTGWMTLTPQGGEIIVKETDPPV